MTVVHEVIHPFCKVEAMDGTRIWTVGCEVIQERMGGDIWIAHGEGKKIMTEVSRYTPPGYGEKVFFTTQYVDPDGERVGQKRLHIMGVKAFERRAAGFVHDYDVEDT